MYIMSKYQCDLCNTIFKGQSSYWTHKYRNKHSCLTKDQCFELIKENNNLKTHIHLITDCAYISCFFI